ncbi:hypothetical protein, partial [Azospirillum sp. B506]|uniref:hypothetical protein n=1 Tax=Azospirillum sp. B506 TaxID=137721 RepID=UPI0005B285B2
MMTARFLPSLTLLLAIAAYSSGMTAVAETPAPSIARINPAPWHGEGALALTDAGEPVAIVALRLGGLTNEQTDRLARDVLAQAPERGTLALIDAADGQLLLLDRRREIAARRLAVYQTLRAAHQRRQESMAVNLPLTLQTMADLSRVLARHRQEHGLL